MRMDKMHEVDMDNDSASTATDPELPHVTFQTDIAAIALLGLLKNTLHDGCYHSPVTRYLALP